MSLGAHPEAAALRGPENQLSTAENMILGHLLGRREDAVRVAQSLGMTRAEVEELCSSLLERHLLSVVEYAGRTLYCVR